MDFLKLYLLSPKLITWLSLGTILWAVTMSVKDVKNVFSYGNLLRLCTCSNLQNPKLKAQGGCEKA